MSVGRLARRIGLGCAFVFAACDSGLHPPETPLGAPYFVDGAVEVPDTTTLPPGELRPALVWTAGLELSDAPVLATVELFFPNRFRIAVHGRPPDRVLQRHDTHPLRWASARVVIYADVSGTRSFRPDVDPIVGSHPVFLLYVDAEVTVQGGALLAKGYHLVEAGVCGDAALLRVSPVSEPMLTVAHRPDDPLVEIDLRLGCAPEE